LAWIRPGDERKKEFKSNSEFWIKKIERNIERDKEVKENLISNGWIVLRFWGREIKKDLVVCVDTIEKAIMSR
jgi:DNA mismatch endonuclease (patch repair protein)